MRRMKIFLVRRMEILLVGWIRIFLVGWMKIFLVGWIKIFLVGWMHDNLRMVPCRSRPRWSWSWTHGKLWWTMGDGPQLWQKSSLSFFAYLFHDIFIRAFTCKQASLCSGAWKYCPSNTDKFEGHFFNACFVSLFHDIFICTVTWLSAQGSSHYRIHWPPKYCPVFSEKSERHFSSREWVGSSSSSSSLSLLPRRFLMAALTVESLNIQTVRWAVMSSIIVIKRKIHFAPTICA